MNQSFADYTEVVASKLLANAPEIKSIPNQPGQSFQQIALNYNYGTDEAPIIDDCFVQLPPVHSTGILEKPDPQNGKTSYSMYVPFSLTDSKHLTYIEKHNALYMRSAEHIFHYKGPLKMPHFNAQNPEVSLYKNPLYFPLDKTTGERIPGKNPSMYFKLIKRGVGNNENKTLFTIPSRDKTGKPTLEPIDWSLLYNVDMVMIPLVQYEKVYIGGGKPSLQLKIVSAIVLDIKPRGSTSRQQSTANTIITEDPDLANKLSEQIAKLTAERQDTLSAPSLSTASTNAPSSSLPQILNNTPQVKSFGTSSLQDFLSQTTNPYQQSTPGPQTPSPLNSVPMTNPLGLPNISLKLQ